MALAVEYHLFMLPARTVFAAQTNTAELGGTSASVGFDNVTTGAYTDVKPEMLVLFGSTPGADNYGRQRVRKAPTSNTLYYGWSSPGDGHGEFSIQDGAYITVLDMFMPWTRNPRILDDGTQYFDYDLTAASNMGLPPSILINCGAAVHEDVSPSTSVATFTFDAIGSYVTDADATAIISWTWTIPAGAVVTDGGTGQDHITFTIAEGAHWVSVTATDDNGTSHTRWILCVAGEPTGTITQFAVEEITRKADGSRLRVRIDEDIPESTYPRGTLAVLWSRWTEDGAEVTPPGLSGRETLEFVGWHHTEDLSGQATERGFISETSLEFVDLAGKLAELPGYPITIERNSSPSQWQHVKTANMDRYFAYILHYMSNALVLGDFRWANVASTYPFPVLASEGQSLYEQVDIRAQAIAHRFAVDQYGRMWIKQDNQLLDESGGLTALDRDTSATWTLTEADWSSYRVSNVTYPRHHWNWGNAIQASATDASAANVTPLFCVAPGRAPGQGLSETTSGEQLVASQLDLNGREGNRYALMNARHGTYEVELVGPKHHAIQPAYMGWLALTISADTAGERGITWTAARFRPAEVVITPDAEAGTQRVIVRLEPETHGEAAHTFVPAAPDGNLPSTGVPDAIEPDTNAAFWLDGTNRIIGYNADGYVYVLTDVHGSNPAYVSVSGAMDGDPVQWVPNAFSPRYMDGSGDVEGWIATTTKLYALTVTSSNTVTPTLQHTFRDTSSQRSMDFEFGREGYGFIASTYDDGVWRTYTTDGGTTWAAEAKVGDDSPGAGPPSGVTFDGTLSNIDDGGAVNEGVPSVSSYTAAELNFEVWYGSGIWWAVEFTADLDSDVTVTELTLRMKRNELLPTFSKDWYTTGGPGTTYGSMPGIDLYYSGGHSTQSFTSNDGEYAYATWTFSPGKTGIYGARFWGGGLRRAPRDYPTAVTVSGVLEIYSINGITSTPLTDIGSPGAYVSTKTPNRVLSSAYYSDTGRGIYSNNAGATVARGLYPPADMPSVNGDARVVNDLHVPFAASNELACYHGKVTGAGARRLVRVESDGTTITDVSPSYGGETYGPWQSRGQVVTYAGDASNVWVIGCNDADQTLVGCWRSTDGGDNWTTLITPTTGSARYTRLAVSGEDPNLVFFYGESGAFGVSYDGGTTIRDVSALAGISGAGEFIGIAGG